MEASLLNVFLSLKCLDVVSTPMVSFTRVGDDFYCIFSNDHRWRLVSAQIGLHIEYRQEMADAASKDSRFLVLEECDDVESGRNASVRCKDKDKAQYFYPQILQVSSVQGQGSIFLPSDTAGQFGARTRLNISTLRYCRSVRCKDKAQYFYPQILQVSSVQGQGSIFLPSDTAGTVCLCVDTVVLKMNKPSPHNNSLLSGGGGGRG